MAHLARDIPDVDSQIGLGLEQAIGLLADGLVELGDFLLARALRLHLGDLALELDDLSAQTLDVARRHAARAPDGECEGSEPTRTGSREGGW